MIDKVLDDETLKEYTSFHDCGKPSCKQLDENGKVHFPDHAKVSAKVWRSNGGNEQVARLIEMDMMVHTMSANDIPEFVKNREAVSLLLTALAEIHANAELFGGLESTSFKIKYKQINKRGAAIIRHFV